MPSNAIRSYGSSMHKAAEEYRNPINIPLIDSTLCNRQAVLTFR